MQRRERLLYGVPVLVVERLPLGGIATGPWWWVRYASGSLAPAHEDLMEPCYRNEPGLTRVNPGDINLTSYY